MDCVYVYLAVTILQLSSLQVVSASSNQTFSTISQIFPAQVYSEQQHILDVAVAFDCTFAENSEKDIIIKIQLPYDTYSAQNCSSLITNTQSCEPSFTGYKDVFSKLSSPIVRAGRNFEIKAQSISDVDTISGLLHYTSVKLSIGSSCSSSQSEANVIKISTPVYIEYNHWGSLFYIRSQVEVNGTLDSETTNSVAVIGPYIQLNLYTSPPSAVEGGDSLTYELHVQHYLHSSADAENVTVQINFDEGHTTSVKNGTYTVTSVGTLQSFTIDSLDGTQLVFPYGINRTDGFTVNIKQVLIEKLPIGEHVLSTATLHFSDNIGHQFSNTWTSPVPTVYLSFTGHSGTDLADFIAGQSYIMSTTFRMPKGKLDLSIIAEFQSDDYNVVPVTIIEARMNVPGSLQHSGQSVLTAADFRSQRKTRSVFDESSGASHHRSKRSFYEIMSGKFGSVINPNPGLSTDTVTITGSMGFLAVILFLLRGLRQEQKSCSIKSALVFLSFFIFRVRNVRPGQLFCKIGLGYGAIVTILFAGTIPVIAADIIVVKSIEHITSSPDTFPSKLRFTSLVYHEVSSTLDAIDVTLTDGNDYFDVFFGENFIGPPINDPNFTVTNDRIMTWKQDPLLIGDRMNLSYVASPNSNLPDGLTNLTSTVTYRNTAGGSLFSVSFDVCVRKQVDIISNVVYQYGFVALGLVVGLILGALLVILILFIVYKVKRKTPFDGGAVSPIMAADTRAIMQSSKSTGLIVKSKSRVKKVLDTSGQNAYDDSLVHMLSIKDKLKALRTLDNMDITGTAHVDQQLENERNNAMIEATKMLLNSLLKNGDISSSIHDKALSNFHKNMDKLDKDLNGDFRKDMENLLNVISIRNRERLGDLIDKQDEEKDNLEAQTKHMIKQERDELMDLLKKQQETEQNELNYRLELEQKEQIEKLRKEKAVRKRIGIKSLQQELLDDVREQGKLSPEQAEWILQEHFKNQAAVERLYDQEISRQRMILEEKLALRRALAENKQLHDEADNEQLNQIVEQQMALIARATKNKTLSKTEAKALMDNVQKEILQAKERMDADRQKQEDSLHKKLSERKAKQMEELLKKQKQEVLEFEKATTSTQAGDGYIDPVSVIENHQKLYSHHRVELTELENKIDSEDVEEYSKLRDSSFKQMKQEMNVTQEKLVNNLEEKGMSSDMIEKILAKHKLEQRKLVDQQEAWKKDQAARLKEELAQRRAHWEQRRLEEIIEQENLRQHEENVVRKLMDNQVALSVEEREKILQEHEKQMVTMENSLTLNKLQQQNMLEEKLAKKRQQQLEKLQKQHAKDAKKLNRSGNEDEGSEIDMLKNQAEDRIAVLRGENLQLDDELFEIQQSMLKERANALKEQELKLGVMLTQLQMEKAKEMARIEEQQEAIYNLKASMMDDLHEKGVLSDPECKRVIEIHKKEQDKLNKKLDSLKQKQEKLLQGRLQERLAQKEADLAQIQKQELKEATRKMSGSATAIKLRQAALATKHMVDLEKFRNRMENEMSQSLQEMKRQNELRRVSALQEQELQFINGLVLLGHFKEMELDNIIHVLFPNKTLDEQKQLLETLMEGSTQNKKQRNMLKDELEVEPSTLEQRVLANTLADVVSETMPSGALKAKKKLKLRGVSTMDDLPSPHGYNMNQHRPEPLGRYSPDGYNESLNRRGPSKLPPLEKIKNKKNFMSREADF